VLLSQCPHHSLALCIWPGEPVWEGQGLGLVLPIDLAEGKPVSYNNLCCSFADASYQVKLMFGKTVGKACGDDALRKMYTQFLEPTSIKSKRSSTLLTRPFPLTLKRWGVSCPCLCTGDYWQFVILQCYDGWNWCYWSLGKYSSAWSLFCKDPKICKLFLQNSQSLVRLTRTIGHHCVGRFLCWRGLPCSLGHCHCSWWPPNPVISFCREGACWAQGAGLGQPGPSQFCWAAATAPPILLAGMLIVMLYIDFFLTISLLCI